MKIHAVQVHNYRGIIDSSVELHDYTILLGANNAGKSTFLAAVCSFYEHDQFKYKYARDWPHQGSTDNESWVDIEYQLSDDEAETVKDDYLLENSRLRVRKYLHSKELAHDGKARSGAYYAYTADSLTHEDFFYGTRNVGKGKLGSIVYIPAVSRVEDHTKMSGPSALRDLLNEILKDIVSTSDTYQSLTSAFTDFGTNIRSEQTAGGRSIDGLQTKITESLSDWDVDFRINLRAPDAAELVKSLSEYQINEQGSTLQLGAEDFGSGFQRNFIYTLINVKANYIEPKAQTKKKTFSPDFNLLLFEEPEAFLHPPQQEKLSDNLRLLSNNEDQQILCSTHSPNFVSFNSNDLNTICRFVREDHVVTSHQVLPAKWDEIIGTAVENNDEDTEALERIRYFLWLNPDRCGALFCSRVLLVEGLTDQVLIRRLIKDGRINCPPDGVHVMDSLGKYNLPRFSKLLSALNIRHSVLFDADANRANHADINAEIEALRGTGTAAQVVALANNIETTLELNLPGHQSQKPARALAAYESGLIEDNNLQVFCGLVNACFE